MMQLQSRENSVGLFCKRFLCCEIRGILIVYLFNSLMACTTGNIGPGKIKSEGKPHLVFEERIYDFGIAGPGQTITHRFKFKNTGSRPVKILGISPSCGTTARLLCEAEISEGETGEILASFQTKRYEGRQKSTMKVYCNDLIEPEIVLEIKGIVKRGFAVVPQGIIFGKVERGKVVKGHVRLLDLSLNNLAVKRIDANNQYFLVTTSKFQEENRRGIEIEITFRADAPLGPFNDVITLHTNIKRHPRLDVPVWADIISAN
ncbi:MAG: DUF1573 domain-containing protein [Nitrospiraceae bacterium]|nr:DUF1573 domain-containing protein [Nitrospiraceae bacterium]